MPDLQEPSSAGSHPSPTTEHEDHVVPGPASSRSFRNISTPGHNRLRGSRPTPNSTSSAPSRSTLDSARRTVPASDGGHILHRPSGTDGRWHAQRCGMYESMASIRSVDAHASQTRSPSCRAFSALAFTTGMSSPGSRNRSESSPTSSSTAPRSFRSSTTVHPVRKHQDETARFTLTSQKDVPPRLPHRPSAALTTRIARHLADTVIMFLQHNPVFRAVHVRIVTIRRSYSTCAAQCDPTLSGSCRGLGPSGRRPPSARALRRLNRRDSRCRQRSSSMASTCPIVPRSMRLRSLELRLRHLRLCRFPDSSVHAPPGPTARDALRPTASRIFLPWAP